MNGKAPVTPVMLDAISQSPYAADIAYYLGKHADQAGAIARLPAPKAASAIHEIETALMERERQAAR